MLATVLPFVLILGLLILVHMLGHFVVKRAFYGVDQPLDLDLSFDYTSVWTRIPIVLAGPAANFLLAVLLFWGVLAFVGRPVPLISTTVGVVRPGFPAAEAGMRTGDRIVAISGEPVETWEELARQIRPRAGQAVRLTIERGGGRFEVILTPRAFTRQDAGDRTLTMGIIGIAPTVDFVYDRLNPLTALVEAAKRTLGTIVNIFWSVWKTVEGVISPQTTTGLILMAQMTGQQVPQGFVNLIFFTALLSINLGMLNLFPLPFLDGGRLCFLVVESIRGRPVSLKARRTTQWVMVLLLAVLMILAVYLTFHDEIFQFLKTL